MSEVITWRYRTDFASNLNGKQITPQQKLELLSIVESA